MKKTLVAFFSPTGTTKATAERIARIAQADIFEIEPETPYTSADLNWNNSQSRSSIEMNDPVYRPSVASRVSNFEQYENVFVGFPIWWYTAPTIIHTFLEQYDWTGRKIVLFATSGGSGMGDTQRILESSAPGAEFVGERCFGYGGRDKEIAAWIDQLALNSL